MTDYLELAKDIAYKAHKGQTRWDGKTPYITHPEAVADLVRSYGRAYEATAWLHDVIEDTTVNVKDLQDAGIPDPVVYSVVLLTKTQGGSYMDYLHGVKSDCIARAVKIADITHNLSTKGSKKGNIVDKWELALYYLQDYQGPYAS